MSFNVRYGTAPDGANAWANRRELLFSVIRAYGGDLIGTQELLAAQRDEILAAVPGYKSVGVGRDNGVAAGEFSAILYKSDRFDVDTSGTFWFSNTPEVPGSRHWGNTLPRICTWARFLEKSTRRVAFYHFNLHVDHESQPSREKSVDLLIKRVAGRKHPSEPCFVTGDFNVGENDIVIQFMKGKQALAGVGNGIPFLDSFRSFDPASTAVGTRHDFTGATGGDKIDYVFVLPRIATLAAAIVRTQANGRYPSDHFPVTADVTVPDWASTSIRNPL